MVDIARSDTGQRKRRSIVRIGIATALITVSAFALGHLRPASPALSRSSAWIDTVRRGDMAVQVRGSGTLVPEQVRWVPAATDGRVDRVLALAGTAVHADTLLVEISNPELQQAAGDAELQLRAAEAELRTRRVQVQSELLSQEALAAAVKADYDDAKMRAAADDELAAAGLTSPLTRNASRGRAQQLAVRLAVEEKRLALGRANEREDVAAAAAKVDQLRALVALKRAQIAALQVRAGSAGVLQQVVVEAGQRVAAGANLARVAAPSPLKASIQVAQTEAARVAIGQSVIVDTHDGTVRGTVSRIDPAVQNGSVTVDVHLPRELPRGARPDLSVDAIIDIDHAAGVLFVGRPVQADPRAGTVVLFRVSADGKSAVRAKVATGRASFDVIEVRGGLAAGDRVILSDMSSFDRAERVDITN